MSATLSCCTPCAEVETVNVPGTEGPAGVDGTNGVNAYTTTTSEIASFANPVSVDVVSSVWLVIGQILIIGDGFPSVGETNWAHFRVTAIPSATSVTLEYLAYPDDDGDLDGVLIVGCSVSPAGMIGPAGP